MLEKIKLTLIKFFIASNLNEKFQKSLKIIKCLKNGDVKPQEVKKSSKVRITSKRNRNGKIKEMQ